MKMVVRLQKQMKKFALRELSVMDTHFYVEYENSPLQTFCHDLEYSLLSFY